MGKNRIFFKDILIYLGQNYFIDSESFLSKDFNKEIVFTKDI